MEDLKQDIATVIAKNYTEESIADFFQKYSFLAVFEIIHNESEELNEQFLLRFVNFLTTIFKHEKYADKFLFDNSVEGKQLLAYIIQNKYTELRQLLPLAIRSHITKITAVLDQCDDNTFDEYVGTLFQQLNDESTEVGLKALDIIRKIVKESRAYNFSVVKRPIFESYLEKGLQHENSVIMMRYFDLLIEVTNASQDIFEAYRSKGLMDLLVQTYQTNDILVKLTVVEAIPKMGDSTWNAKFINEALVQKSMLEECFDENADFYVRKNLAVLIAKLVARGTLSLNQKLKAGFSNMCRNWIASGYKEELYGVLDVIGSLVLKQSGVEIIFSNEELLISFFALSLKTDTTMKQKFLFTYSQFFNEEFDKKLSAFMKKALTIVGHIEDVVQMKKTIQEIPTTSFDRSFKWLLKILHFPFVDIELEGLVLLKNILRFDWSVMDFAKQENSVSYLTEHAAKSKEIYDLKREIIKEVVTRLEESKDIFLIEFRKKLIAGKSNMKGPADKTGYATEFL